MKQIIKRGLCLLLFIFLMNSCSYDEDYTYTYTAKVTYTDSNIDTLTFGRDSFKGNKVYVYLKIKESGVLGGGGTSPCLMIGCGFYKTPIACGVRKYEILNETKVPLIKK